MGSNRAPDESPAHPVRLDAYRIDVAEVSIAEFEAFVAASGYERAENWSDAGRAWLDAHPGGAGATLRASGRAAEHPVVAVTWFEAEAFCKARGGALPTEAQWEYAACGGRGTRYTWGDTEDFGAAWFGEGKTGQLTSVHTRAVHEEGAGTEAPNGIRHTAGNVWEWTQDSYDAGYYADKHSDNPVNDRPGTWRTARGGAFDNLPSYCTCTHREPMRPAEPRLTVGFRCAYPANSP